MGSLKKELVFAGLFSRRAKRAPHFPGTHPHLRKKGFNTNKTPEGVRQVATNHAVYVLLGFEIRFGVFLCGSEFADASRRFEV